MKFSEKLGTSIDWEADMLYILVINLLLKDQQIMKNELYKCMNVACSPACAYSRKNENYSGSLVWL
jgi:hypothetical protein